MQDSKKYNEDEEFKMWKDEGREGKMEEGGSFKKWKKGEGGNSKICFENFKECPLVFISENLSFLIAVKRLAYLSSSDRKQNYKNEHIF